MPKSTETVNRPSPTDTGLLLAAVSAIGVPTTLLLVAASYSVNTVSTDAVTGRLFCSNCP